MVGVSRCCRVSAPPQLIFSYFYYEEYSDPLSRGVYNPVIQQSLILTFAIIEKTMSPLDAQSSFFFLEYER